MMRFSRKVAGSCVGILVVGLIFGCGGGGGGGGGGNTTTTTTTGPGAGTPGTTVTDNPTSIVTWGNIQGQTNVTATMRVNDSGTTVDEIPIKILTATVMSFNISGKSESGVDAIYCLPSNGRGVFEGDSGSPVLINGSIAGGLFGSSDDEHFYARGIEQMEATASGPPIIPGQTTLTSRITPQWYFEGSQRVLSHLRANSNFGKTIYAGTAPGRAKKPILGGSSVPPIPGRRYASPFVIGPYAVGYDMATYTLELSNGNWVATGHGLEDAGTVSWPITSVSVTGLDSSTDSVNANIIGNIYGTMLYDGEDGSLINPNTPAATMPVVMNTTLNSVPQGAVTHQVRFDLGSSTEDQGIEVAAQATIDAEENSTGSLTASGTMQFTVGGTTTTKTLSFPSGETLDNLETTLGNDIGAILTAQHNSAPTAQVQSVTINLTVNG